MTYYEVVNLVTVTKTNMIDEMPSAYGTLRVVSGPIYNLLMYPMNPFWRMVTVGHNATVFSYNRITTKLEETAKPRSEGDIQCDASYWRRARSSLSPGCLWRLWQSTSTLTEPFRPDRNVFSWCTYIGRVHHPIYSGSGEQQCGTRPEKGLNIANCCANGYSITGAPAKSETEMLFWWCIYVTTFRAQSKRGE